MGIPNLLNRWMDNID